MKDPLIQTGGIIDRLRPWAEPDLEYQGPNATLIQDAIDEIEELRIWVIAFGAPWAVEYARERGLPDKHLYPTHYDILERAGARMDDYVRSDIES